MRSVGRLRSERIPPPPQRPVSIVDSSEEPAKTRRFVHRPKPIEVHAELFDLSLRQ
jgi:hypothetical protein